MDRGPDAGQRRELAGLQTLGYVDGSEKPVTDQIITVHVPDKVFAGLNLYISAHAPEAILMDMDGKVLHRWHFEPERAWPNLPETYCAPRENYWRRVRLFENGDILAMHELGGLLRIDKDSNLIWATLNSAHHDMDLMPNGDICVLTQIEHIVPSLVPHHSR